VGIHLVKEMMDDIDYQRVEGKNKLILKKCVDRDLEFPVSG